MGQAPTSTQSLPSLIDPWRLYLERSWLASAFSSYQRASQVVLFSQNCQGNRGLGSWETTLVPLATYKQRTEFNMHAPNSASFLLASLGRKRKSAECSHAH